MKRLLLILTLVVAMSVSYSQARLGFTPKDILTEFYDYDYESGFNDAGEYFVAFNTDYALVLYIFNEDLICINTLIMPHTQVDLNMYVQLYNNQYVTISDTQWRGYSEQGIANITLIYPEDGGYLFIWE